MESASCLTFLQIRVRKKVCAKYSPKRVIGVMQKTWKKMSAKGREAALALPFSPASLEL